MVGNWRIAFLLPSLLAGLGTLWLVWDMGRRLFSPRAGLLAAVAVLSALMFSFQFKRAQIDPLITFLITGANWALLRHLLGGPQWRVLLAGLFCRRPGRDHQGRGRHRAADAAALRTRAPRRLVGPECHGATG